MNSQEIQAVAFSFSAFFFASGKVNFSSHKYHEQDTGTSTDVVVAVAGAVVVAVGRAAIVGVVVPAAATDHTIRPPTLK